MTMTKKIELQIKQAGYAQGYQTGLKRNKRDASKARLKVLKDRKRERIFLSVFNGLMASGNTCNWKMGEKKILNSDDYIELAILMTDLIINKL